MAIIRGNGRLAVAIGILAAVILLGVLGPPLLTDRATHDVVGGLYDEPSTMVWLGTDNLGHDVFANLLYGLRTSLYIGLFAGAAATLIGVVVGTTAGFAGGAVEEALMGVTNVLLAIPTLVLLILISVSVQSRSATGLAVVVALTSWPWTARAVRAQANSLRTREHIDIARLSGARTPGIILHDVVPYLRSYIAVAFVLQASGAILNEAALSLLGLGPSDGVSLGIMLQWALLWESVRSGAWWAFLPPTIVLTLVAFALQMLVSSLNEVFDPRLRRDRPARRSRRRAPALVAPRMTLETADALDAPQRPVPRQTNPAANRPLEVSTAAPLLAARNLRAVYRGAGSTIVAVDDISLTVDQGEVLGIAGESGCGKSTLASVLSLTARPGLQVIAGGLEVAGDRISLDQHEAPPRSWRGTICLLPQSAMSALSPTVRIGDLAVHVIRAHAVVSRSEALDQAAARLDQLDLPRRVLGSYPHELSGGMRQRVVTVLSTLVSPRVLIADEPTSALDVSNQRIVIDLLRELLRQRLVGAIVLVTHDLPLLRTVADRIAIMYAGQLVEVGSADEIINGARHPYTSALLRSVLDFTPRGRVTRIPAINGEPPDLAVLPSGCRFHPRCGLAMPVCGESSPPRVGDDLHYATCWSTSAHRPVEAELTP